MNRLQRRSHVRRASHAIDAAKAETKFAMDMAESERANAAHWRAVATARRRFAIVVCTALGIVSLVTVFARWRPLPGIAAAVALALALALSIAPQDTDR